MTNLVSRKCALMIAILTLGFVGYSLYAVYIDIGYNSPLTFQSYPYESNESTLTTSVRFAILKSNVSSIQSYHYESTKPTLATTTGFAVLQSTVIRCTPEFKQYHFMEFKEVLGRVGNQMFQLFMLLSTADKNCYTPLLEKFKNILGDIFELQYTQKDASRANKFHWKELEIKSNAYNVALEHLDNSVNWRFKGYFQSWKYFSSNAKFIKSILKFKSEVLATAYDFINTQNLTKDINVCVHVRRGDFLEKKYSTVGFSTAGKSYLEKAMAYFKTKHVKEIVNFIYLSDDMQWCQDNVKEDNIYFSTFASHKGGAGIDLALMSLCNHSIITVGSFGWMGAWLNGGDAVYYSDFPRSGSLIDGLINKTEYYLPHWIGMNDKHALQP